MTDQEVAYRKIQSVFNPTGEKFGDDPEPDYPPAA
ncbi:Uncharacterised protein [Corynebacterium minutissimum]|uniref:Uncharacterized protein n=1 Tax=Corynebacterium minutissimum TaxID=38301 RepID=A0A376CW81_9CORY|nr:Uncharacterised protein [Corynebacterium minutissimum]